MAASSQQVDLGFTNKSESWKLLSHFFPSKVGGKPAWLSFKPLPTLEDVSCGNCGKPCIFLLQIYAPVEEVNTCFHRTLFVFVCRDPGCCKRNENGNFKVFRSQLSRENDFYSSSPPDDSHLAVNHPNAKDYGASLCDVCGSIGPKRCARCKTVAYCSKEHQTIDWKAGHKKNCGSDTPAPVDHSSVLMPEFELVMEEEEYNEIKDEEKSEEERKKEFEDFLVSTKAATGSDPTVDEDLDKMARKETADDRIFQRFKKRIANEPEQVLRYDRGGTPLWVSSENLPVPDDIPKCKCGAERHLEFQVMPQLLIHLKLDATDKSIDWGTLVIYSCSANCDPGASYNQEFLWKQDFSEKDINIE